MRRLTLVILAVVALLGAAISFDVETARAEPPPLEHPEPPNAFDPAQPLAPVKLGTRTFYAIGADLVEWSDAEHALVARVRMPARIVALTPSSDALILTLAVRDPSRDRATLVYRPDAPKPGRGYWTGGYGEALRTMREARTIASGFDPDRGDLDVAHRDAAIAALAARERVDRTNPFLAAVRGQLLLRGGKREEAQAAFVAAVELRAAVFDDVLRLSSLLEDEGFPELAQRAFDRGFAGLVAAGLRPEQLRTQLSVLILLGVPRRALAAAIAAGNVERVDLMMERVARVAPHVEGGPAAFGDLATWMHTKGREDLAAKWRARADAAAASPPNAVRALVRRIDRMVPQIAGAAVVAPLVAFVIGARRAARRHDPRRRVVTDLLSAFAVIVALMVYATVSAAWTDALARHAAAPTALMDDGVASPDVARYLEHQLPASDERNALLAYVRSESSATASGGRAQIPPPGDATLVAAIQRSSWGAAFASAMRGSKDRPGLFQPHLIVLAAAAAFLFGWTVGTRAPRAGMAASRVIPGAPESLGIVGPVLGAAFVASLFAFAGADRVLESLSSPAGARTFGLEALATAQPAASRAWAWVMAIGYVFVHLVGVSLDRARAARENQGTTR